MYCSHTDYECIFYILPSYYQGETLFIPLILNGVSKVYHPYASLEINIYFAPIITLKPSLVE
jgi:hypothetical protein